MNFIASLANYRIAVQRTRVASVAVPLIVRPLRRSLSYPFIIVASQDGTFYIAHRRGRQ